MHRKKKKNAATPLATARETITAYFVGIGIAILVFVVFGRTLQNGFVNYDDNVYVYDNPSVTAGLSFAGIGWAFTHVHADNWHPLTTISHMLDCQLFGVHPWGHHLTNVLLHAIAAISLFFALCQLTMNSSTAVIDRRYSFWASAFVATLFAIHPLRVESVAWISERKDVLSGVFLALILWTYAHYAREKRHRAAYYGGVIIFFALGLLCKPTLVTVPFVLLVLDYWPLRRMQGAGSKEREEQSKAGSGKSQARALSAPQHFSVSVFNSLVAEKIPLFVLSVASCIVTVIAQKEALDTMRRLTFQERFANAVLSYAIYLGQMIYPARLTPLNPFTQNGPSSLAVILCLAGLWIVTITCFIWLKRFPFLVTGWLWYVGMLVPMSGIVQVGWQTRADRYTYLSQIGLYMLGTWGALSFANHERRNWKVLSIAACGVVAALMIASYFQTFYWRDSETLWQHALEVNPKNYIAHNNLGNSIMANGHIEEAVSHFRAAIEANPDYAEGHYNLGNALAAQDRYLEAITSFQAAIRSRPNFYQAYNNMGCMLIKVGRTNESIAQFNEALRIHPDYQEAHLNLGQLLTRLGRTDEGQAHLAEGARLKTVHGEKKELSNFAVSPQ